MSTSNYSKRSFRIVATDGGKTNSIGEPFSWSLDELLSEDNDFEVVYALQDIIDVILDLQLGDAMYFQPNRDDSKSKAIIVRIK